MIELILDMEFCCNGCGDFNTTHWILFYKIISIKFAAVLQLNASHSFIGWHRIATNFLWKQFVRIIRKIQQQRKILLIMNANTF